MTQTKILIVDDDEVTRRLLGARLQHHNYDTVTADDAVTAINVARSERPDAILLDLGLPGGDGFVVLERLKTQPALAAIPVIVVSAREERTNGRRALAGGAVGFVQKPVDNQKLLEAIAVALGQEAHTPAV
jgi:CheY-like chemotaxis protein